MRRTGAPSGRTLLLLPLIVLGTTLTAPIPSASAVSEKEPPVARQEQWPRVDLWTGTVADNHRTSVIYPDRSGYVVVPLAPLGPPHRAARASGRSAAAH